MWSEIRKSKNDCAVGPVGYTGSIPHNSRKDSSGLGIRWINSLSYFGVHLLSIDWQYLPKQTTENVLKNVFTLQSCASNTPLKSLSITEATLTAVQRLTLLSAQLQSTVQNLSIRQPKVFKSFEIKLFPHFQQWCCTHGTCVFMWTAQGISWTVPLSHLLPLY